jgi:DNA-binding response OmpR family regulator
MSSEEVPVLIVESDTADAEQVRASFTAHGWPMTIAETGEHALGLLRSGDRLPRCILLDLKLRGALNGFDVLQLVRTDPRMHRLPIIIYTGEYSRADLVRAFELGASSVIRRPVESPAKVLALVEFFLGDLDARIRDARVRVKRQFLELQARAENERGDSPLPPSGLDTAPRESWFR